MGRVEFLRAIMGEESRDGGLWEKGKKGGMGAGGLVNWQKSRCFTRGHFVSSNLQEKSTKLTHAWSAWVFLWKIAKGSVLYLD